MKSIYRTLNPRIHVNIDFDSMDSVMPYIFLMYFKRKFSVSVIIPDTHTQVSLTTKSRQTEI